MSSTFLKYLLLFIFLILLATITNSVLNYKVLLYNSLTDQFTAKQIKHIFELQDKWRWVRYSIFSILLLIKISLVASSLFIGTFFFSKIPVTYKQMWDFVVSAEFVFLLAPFFKIVWFYYFQTNYNLNDVQYFYPLSVLNIVCYKDLEPWFVYPFQILNLFELTYWFILAYYIGKATKTSIVQGLKIVVTSYGLVLLLWVVTIMFFTLNYS